MRVFVLTTGRTGSVTFSKACELFENYTTGHESKARDLTFNRAKFPDNHIEIDNRLTFFLAWVDQPDTFYVHLVRNEKDVVRSYLKRYRGRHTLVKGFLRHIFMLKEKRYRKIRAAYLTVRSMNDNIRYFLRDKSYMTIELEEIEYGFLKFMKAIDAKGDYGKICEVLTTKNNKSQ